MFIFTPIKICFGCFALVKRYMLPWCYSLMDGFDGARLPGLVHPAFQLLNWVIKQRNFNPAADLLHTCMPIMASFFKYDWKKESWRPIFCSRHYSRFANCRFSNAASPVV